MMIDGTNRHSGLGRDNISRIRHRLNTKKAGRIPIRERIGPAKNLLKKRKERRPARHKGTMVSAGVFCIILEQKRCFKLGGFMRSFAENTDVKSFESRFRWLRKTKFNYKYTLIVKKNQVVHYSFQEKRSPQSYIIATSPFFPPSFWTAMHCWEQD